MTAPQAYRRDSELRSNFFFPGHIWQHPMNGKSLFSWQSEVNIYAVWVNNPRTAAHHATFAFDLKRTGVKEKYTQFMKGIAICESKLRTTPLPFPCLLLILQMPWFSPYGLMPRENFFFNWHRGKCTFSYTFGRKFLAWEPIGLLLLL